MQNIHKWSKAMQISDTATSDYSTHTELEALSFIVSAHLEDKQSYCDYEKQNSVFCFVFYFFGLSLGNHSGQRLILTILLFLFLSVWIK